MHKAHDDYCHELLAFVKILKTDGNLEETDDEFRVGDIWIADKSISVLHSLETTPLVLKKKIK